MDANRDAAAPGATPRVDVVIPTALLASRAALVSEAIDSVLSQQAVAHRLILVANGPAIDPGLLARVAAMPALTLLRQAAANVSEARRAGLAASQADYYCFLDDDDVLLRGALHARVAALDAHPEWDFLITDGLIREAGRERRTLRDDFAARVRADPAAAFLERNWFDSPGSTFRRTSVGPAYFASGLRHFEWTWLLLRLLADGKRVGVDDALTFAKREDSPDSVSRSPEYLLALPDFLAAALRLPLPPVLRAGLARRRAAAFHACADHHLRAGDARAALRWHLACLRAGGWRYAGASRHILAAWLRRTPAR
jgi:glycosyltransferase involved in cell wall biosynthesis